MEDEMVLEAVEAAPAPKKKFRAVYIGEGAFISGVPARDLSQEEWEAIGTRRQEAAIAGGIFKIEGGK